MIEEKFGRIETIIFVLALAGIIWGLLKLRGYSIRMEGE